MLSDNIHALAEDVSLADMDKRWANGIKYNALVCIQRGREPDPANENQTEGPYDI